ncbi:hypothetical protein BC830DRAFT_932517 [Chytriomyces sp. MP71]|nr:hypothetical protein BC830DRAFT_932517 [Chytriomyces sp. MP71]
MDLSYGYAELIAKPSQKTIPSACDRGNPVDAFGILAVSGIHNQGKAGLVDLVAPQSEPCEEVVDAKATSKDSRNILDVSAITKDEEPTHSVHEGESADQESLPSTSISSGKQDSMKFLNVRGKSPGESSTPVFSGGKNSSAPQISSRPQSVRHPHHPHSSLSVTSSIKSATISEKGGSLSCLRIDGISLHRNLSTSHLLSFPKASESTIFNDSSRSNAKVGYPFAHGPALAVHQDPNLVYLTAVNMITSDEGHCMATVSFENLNRESIDDHGYPVHTESLKVHHSVPWDTVQPGKHEEFSVGHASESETIAVVKNIRMESEAFPVKYASNCKDSVPGSLTSRVNGTSLHDLTLLTSESHGDIKRARFNKVSSPIDTKEDEHDSSKIRSPDKQGTKSAVSIRTLSAATISSATRIPKQPQLPETVYQPLTSGPLYQLFTESPLSKASQLDGSNHSGTSIAHQIVPSTSLENNSVRNSETKKSGHTNVSALGHDANLVSSETPASDLSEKQGRVEEFEGKVDQDRVHNAAGSSYTVDFMKTTEGEGAMEVGGSKLSISGSNSVNASTASASTTTAHHTGASALSRSHLEKNSCGSVNKRESGPTASELVDPSAATVATTPAPFAHSQQQDAMSQIKLEPHRSHSNVALKKRLPTKHDSSPILVGDGYKQNKSSKEPSSQDYDGDLFHSKSDADVFKYTPASGTAHTTSTGSLSRQKVLHTTSGRILHGLVTTTQGGGSRGSLAPKGSHGAEDDLTPKAKRKNGGGSSGAIEASALASGSMTGSRDFFKPSNSMADVFSAGRINNDELVTNRTRNEEFGIEDRKGGQNANGSAQAANRRKGRRLRMGKGRVLKMTRKLPQ